MTPTSSMSDPAVALELGKRLASNARRLGQPKPRTRLRGIWNRLFARSKRVKLASARG